MTTTMPSSFRFQAFVLGLSVLFLISIQMLCVVGLWAGMFVLGQPNDDGVVKFVNEKYVNLSQCHVALVIYEAFVNIVIFNLNKLITLS